jgi:hypothetical protein
VRADAEMFQAARNRQPHTLCQREEPTKGQQTQAANGPSLWKDPENAALRLSGFLLSWRSAIFDGPGGWVHLNKSRVEQRLLVTDVSNQRSEARYFSEREWSEG